MSIVVVRADVTVEVIAQLVDHGLAATGLDRGELIR